MITVLRLRCVNAWAIQWPQEVLPLVPVTPMTHSLWDGSPYTWLAMSPARAFSLGTAIRHPRRNPT